jgi:radical SAM protein (TIGR01212 family)
MQDQQQPFNSYSRYIKKTYRERVQKIPIHAGFSCPNRDGTKGLGGCTFCNNESFSYHAGNNNSQKLTLEERIKHTIAFYQKRFPDLKKFIIYFQSYSNTHKPLKELEQIYQEALSVEGVIGLSIGTRADCLDSEKISYLSELAKNYDITLEIGLESFHDETLLKINRCHNVDTFFKAIELSKNKGLKICTHLMFGFPWEDEIHHKLSAQQLKNLEIDFIKFHQLQIIKGTSLGAEYQRLAFPIITKLEYFEILGHHLTQLHPKTVVQRLFSNYSSDYLLSPSWGTNYSDLVQEFTDFMKNKNLFQGMQRT